MPNRLVASRLRSIAHHLHGDYAPERVRIEHLADSFDALVANKTSVQERERLLAAVAEIASAFDRRGTGFRDMATAMRELELVVKGLISR
jgi:hypothetical protein